MTFLTCSIRRSVLAVLLLAVTAGTGHAQQLDSVRVDRSANPDQLYVRFRFPDSSYYLTRSLDRVALIYPPVQLLTFYYRSCEYVWSAPLRDTLIPILMPEPYRLQIALVRDTNTVDADCMYAAAEELADSVRYSTQATAVYAAKSPASAVALFPNPARETLYVLAEPGDALRICDGTGRVVGRHLQRDAQSRIEIGGLAAGTYYLVAERAGRALPPQRFTKLP